jgi:hypothetical protein
MGRDSLKSPSYTLRTCYDVRLKSAIWTQFHGNRGLCPYSLQVHHY